MNMRPFQIILIAIFAIIAVISIVLLSGYTQPVSEEELVYGNQVIIWGTLDPIVMDRLFQNIMQEDKPFGAVSYRRIDEASFDDEFLNAVAEGRSPDMIILSSEDLVKYKAKLLPIPYENYPVRTFRDTFVDGAEIFALREGVYAIPFAVDPLMMYWNRDIFASNGIAEAPRTWEQVVNNVVPKTTVRDAGRNITQSGIAFGEFRNVLRAKDMLVMLALQSGSASITENERGFVIGLNENTVAGGRAPLESSLQFFTDFSNANSASYSWNRALPQDTQAFTAGDLALYFGRASEAAGIDSKNPNLNFDITTVPQGGQATARRGYGTFYGFAIPRASANVNGAYAAASRITSQKFADELTTALTMAPVRRDLVAAGSADPFRASMLDSALIARGWLDPDPAASDGIMMQMVEDVVSNRLRLTNDVGDAISRLVLEY